jgi:hypothetical protein
MEIAVILILGWEPGFYFPTSASLRGNNEKKSVPDVNFLHLEIMNVSIVV